MVLTRQCCLLMKIILCWSLCGVVCLRNACASVSFRPVHAAARRRRDRYAAAAAAAGRDGCSRRRRPHIPRRGSLVVAGALLCYLKCIDIYVLSASVKLFIVKKSDKFFMGKPSQNRGGATNSVMGVQTVNWWAKKFLSPSSYKLGYTMFVMHNYAVNHKTSRIGSPNNFVSPCPPHSWVLGTLSPNYYGCLLYTSPRPRD